MGRWPSVASDTRSMALITGSGVPVNIEVPFPENRSGKPPFVFKVPTVAELAVSANRLLKFAYPPVHFPRVYLQLLVRQLNAPGITRRELETLSLRQLETLYLSLWQAALGGSPSDADRLHHPLFLAMFAAEYDLNRWVTDDLRQLAETPETPLHSYYSHNAELEAPHLNRVLLAAGHASPIPESAADLRTAYLSVRAGENVLPWQALLERLSESASAATGRLPNLAALRRLFRLTREAGLKPGEDPVGNWREFLLGLDRNALSPPLARPVRMVVVVEGVTEELLVPAFARLCGIDAARLGIRLIAAGGKNQVVPMCRELIDTLAVPVFTVLDHDAAGAGAELSGMLRPMDRVLVLSEGEFEDLYQPELIIKVLNRYYDTLHRLGPGMFNEPLIVEAGPRRVGQLRALWRHCGLGAFDKINFAQKLADYLARHGTTADVPPTVKELLGMMMKVYPDALPPQG